MAVTIKSIDGYEVLSKLGFTDKLVFELQEKGIKPSATPTKLVFHQDGEVLKSVAVKSADLKKMLDGKMGSKASVYLASSVFEALHDLLEHEPDHKTEGLDSDSHKVVAGAEKTAKQTLETGQTGKKSAAVDYAKGESQTVMAKLKGKPAEQISGWPVATPDEINTKGPVRLRDANKLYQPVRGSSKGSRYFMIAGGEHLRVAARYKGTKLSLRIEGPSFNQLKKNVQSCGFTNISESDGVPYASMHVQVEDHVTAQKVAGAVMLGLGVTMETPMPDLSIIFGKGV